MHDVARESDLRVVRSLAAPAVVAASDECLLECVAAGDRAAFSQLYDRMAPAIFGLARRIVVDHAMAEEVTQDVLLAVWSKAPAFDPTRGSARAWILTIAHRRAVDVVRQEQSSRDRIQRVAAASVERPFDEVAESVADSQMRDSTVRDVSTAMATLTPLQRRAVELAYFKGCTYREVAEILDVPLGTAKTRIRDGLHRMAASLGV